MPLSGCQVQLSGPIVRGRGNSFHAICSAAEEAGSPDSLPRVLQARLVSEMRPSQVM